MRNDLAFMCVFALMVVLGQLTVFGDVLAAGIVLAAGVIAYRWTRGSHERLVLAAVGVLWLSDELFGLMRLGLFPMQIAAWTIIAAWLTKRHHQPCRSSVHRWRSIAITTGVCALMSVVLQAAFFYILVLLIARLMESDQSIPAPELMPEVLRAWPTAILIALLLWWIERNKGAAQTSEPAQPVA